MKSTEIPNVFPCHLFLFHSPEIPLLPLSTLQFYILHSKECQEIPALSTVSLFVLEQFQQQLVPTVAVESLALVQNPSLTLF
jgi:hypothetical protein